MVVEAGPVMSEVNWINIDNSDIDMDMWQRLLYRGDFYAQKTGAVFQIRFRDSSVTIPNGGQIYP
ncbi:hypothetical protein [Streptomyces sp. NPDC001381]|uniref:hypothetical protein n=1 Tax=Streptomyces sp. NPDC001381 TaxID=3364567 RepID=UPI0036D1ACA9